MHSLALHGAAFLFSGHGSGCKYYSYEQMLTENDPFSAISLLMGCSSVRMGSEAGWVYLGAPVYYLMNAAPVVVGMTFCAAARARRRSLWGTSRMRWSLV